ncbi:MAG TPA: hypothetical protein VJ455_12775 [Ignavibacteria bacterium]|nr:hypothetical protein [Ignavibacteria bacterium]
MMINLFGMSIPFLFTGFWNVYNVFYEKKVNYSTEYFSWRKSTSLGIGAFYNPKIIVPVFIIMFGTTALAIAIAFLSSSKSTEDISIAVLPVSFAYGLVLTIYFLVKINRETKALISGDLTTHNPGNTTEDIGVKIAFFFASVATLGLFAIGWWIYKKLKHSDESPPDDVRNV